MVWNGQALEGRGFTVAVSRLLEAPSSRKILKDEAAMPLARLRKAPAALLGKALRYYGIQTTSRRPRRNNGGRQVEYALDLGSLEKVGRLAARVFQRLSGEPVPSLRQIDSKTPD